jgi:hypothetical protein
MKCQRLEGFSSSVPPEAKRVAVPRPTPWGQKTMHNRRRALKRGENNNLEHKLNSWVILVDTPARAVWRWLMVRS